MIEDFDIFGIKNLFFCSILLRILTYGIGSYIFLAQVIINLEIVIKKFLSLANLFGAKSLCDHELSEIIIVGKYEDFMLIALKVVFPSFENLNNG